jgi:hypothetical protein
MLVKMSKRRMLHAFVVIVSVISSNITFAQENADQGDMGFKVILCLADGLPEGCGDALSYMLDRISPPRHKPPIGFCPMSNGEGYTAYDAPYSYLNANQPSGWDCGDSQKLFSARHEEDHGPDRIEAFCYTESKTTTHSDEGESKTRVGYLDRSAATPVNFEIKIAVEPNTPLAFESPKYKVYYNTAYSRAVSGGTPLVTLNQ